MAGSNQGQGRRNNHSGSDRNNANPQGSSGQDTAEGTTQDVADRFREGYEQAREELAHRYRRAEGMMARNPGNSLLVGFGLGFGIGLAVTALLTHREETWAERYLPDSMQDLPDRLRRTRIPKAVRDAQVPDSVHETLHYLTEAVRDLPSSVSKLIGR